MLPDYKGGSTVNLMSSILKAYDAKSKYKPLIGLNTRELKKAKNFVLLLIDGLGYEYVKKYLRDTVFYKKMVKEMTSVFPSSTASAITVFHTGLAPGEHGITGWFTYLKELGMVTTVLSLKPATGGSISEEFDPKIIYNVENVYDKIKPSSYIIYDKKITKTSYTKIFSGKAKVIGYEKINELFNKIEQTVKRHNRRKYIFAYWPRLDGLCHEHGVENKKVLIHAKKLGKKIKRLVKKLKGTNTILIITGDHGEITSPKSNILNLKKYPKFTDCLTLPVSGDQRAGFLHVKPGKLKDFKKFIKRFKKYGDIIKSDKLIKKNYFGLHKPSKMLEHRIGDYVFIPKKNYQLNSSLLNRMKGVHGGTSRQEMLVPLIIINSEESL